MTLFSDESTILEEVPIDYENKVATYDNYFVEFAPILFMRRNLLMWRVIKFICLWLMKRMLYVIVILLVSFMMLLKFIMKEEHMLVGIAIYQVSSLCVENLEVMLVLPSYAS